MKRILAASILAASLIGTLVGTASADDQRVRLRGTVSAVAGNQVTIATPTGAVSFPITPATRVQYLVKSDLSVLKPGTTIGSVVVTGPDGTLRAREVHVFPSTITPTLGQTPWDTEPGAVMTNAAITTIDDAKIDAVGGHVLTVTMPSGEKKIALLPTTPILTYAPADRTALVAGAHIIVNAVKHDDGSYTVASINVGQNGLVPPY